MLGEWFRSRSGGARPGVNERHARAVERRLSAARVVLAVASLVALLAEHRSGIDLLGAGVLGAFALYSALLAFELARQKGDDDPRSNVLHAADLAWTMAVFSANGGVNGPFLGYFLFLLLASGYRFGLLETVMTGGAGILATVGDPVLRAWFAGAVIDWHVVAIDAVYLAVGTGLVGYLAEDERRHREQTWAASEILGRIRPHQGLVASMQNVLDSLLRQLSAPRAMLVIADADSDRVFLWHAQAGEHGGRTAIRLRQETRGACGTWLFDVPPRAEGWRAVRRLHAAGDTRVAALDASGERFTAPVNLAPLFAAPFDWQQVLCLTSMAGEGWQGRLFVFDPRVWRPGEHNLRFLQVVLGQVGPALFNLYLQRRLGSRSGALERADIARQLHDGVIQSLIGIEMQIDVLRRQAGTGSCATADDLTGIQGVLEEEILNLRDLMQVLKPADVGPDRLVEHLTGEIAHFRSRTHIDARLSCAEEEIDLTPRACREVAAIVREALANVRKHAGATTVLVRFSRSGGGWLLTVDDNGRGFGFEGTLDGPQLEARHLAPVIIGERVRAIGGRLAVSSRPGTGSRLDISIPGRHHA
jgi:signal transduction histidine kinase